MPTGLTRLTERSGAAKLSEWINEITDEKQLDLGEAFVETTADDVKQPDVLIYEKPRSENVLILIECKRPEFDVYNYDELKKPAYEKAARRRAPYYGTCNFRKLIWYSTKRTAAGKGEEDQIIDQFDLSAIKDLEEIREPVNQIVIRNALGRFLIALYEVATGKTAEPKPPIDDIVVWRLDEKIDRLSRFYKNIISNRFKEDRGFEEKIRYWFADQSWNFTASDDDFAKAARQAAHLLVNKILFYNVLQTKQRISQLELSKGIVRGETLRKNLQNYFDEVLGIDYETIYTTDFIDEAAFPDDTTVIQEIVDLVEFLKERDFSKIDFEILGRIFQNLIPPERRHELGQYFTPADVVDLILGFCLRGENDDLLDPGCGAGTFLVRAYRQKTLMNPMLREEHERILETLYGFDIAKFPAHLSTINLAIRNLAVTENYPRIFHTDFFKEKPAAGEEAVAAALKAGLVHIPKPGLVDAVVGNPPYTRQEEMARITGDPEYKLDVIEAALHEDSRKIADISRRAGIHAYFFVHGYKFLKEGGRFGFVVSNSWLDVGYGAGLQEFFLKNYKILAIVESKVERWFEGADVNTCLVILEKSSDEKMRNDNPARFVYLKKQLSALIPPAADAWEGQIARRRAVTGIVETVLGQDEAYESDDLRVKPVKQRELWEEGYDAEKGRYVGAKWGKYVRAPAIYFKILEKCADKLVPLKEVAEVRRGFTTGANEFFYLTEEEIARLGIEKEFWMHNDKKGNWVPNILIKSPRGIKKFEVQPTDIETRVLIVKEGKEKLKNKKVYNYVKTGEARKIDKNPTCSSRGDKWYELPDIPSPDLLWIKGVNDRHFVPVVPCDVYIDQQLYGIYLNKKKHKGVISGYLNSSLVGLFSEVTGRTNFGEGVLWIATYETEDIPTINPDSIDRRTAVEIRKAFRKLKKHNVRSALDEIGVSFAREIELKKIKNPRRDLDAIIMGKVLGLSEPEQTEVYRGLVDLINTRLAKAASVVPSKKKPGGIDTEQLAKNVLGTLGEDTLASFVREHIAGRDDLVGHGWKPAEPVTVDKDLYGWFVVIGKDKVRGRIDCRSEAEARYLAAWAETGAEAASVPADLDHLEKVLPEFLKLKERVASVIDDYTRGIIDQRLRARIVADLWERVRSE